MERKTKVHAEEGKHDLTITREFDLPVDLLFRAYTEAELVEQWMGTKVVKLDSKKHGSWQYETKGPDGNVAFTANGVIHDIITDKKLVRTFEMAGIPLGVQLEVNEFEALSADTSRLTVHVIYESPEKRDQQLKLPFSYGINMAHDRLEEIIGKLK